MSKTFASQWHRLRANLPTPINLHPESNWLPGESHTWTSDEDMKAQGFDPLHDTLTWNDPLFSTTRFPGYHCVMWETEEESHAAVFFEDTWTCCGHWVYVT